MEFRGGVRVNRSDVEVSRRERRAGDTGRRVPWLKMAVTALSAMVIFEFEPSRFSFFPVCLFHKMTGLLCPGCGSLRALHQLLHGNLSLAFAFNPLLLVCCPFAAWWGVKYFIIRSRSASDPLPVRAMPGGRLESSGQSAFTRRSIGLVGFGIVVVVTFTIWRNLPSFPIPMPAG